VVASAFPEKVDTVMRGLVPRIHDFRAESKAWMAATSAAMTGHRFNLIGKCSKCQKLTNAPLQRETLFDHLVNTHR
jgi:hypothetical protein